MRQPDLPHIHAICGLGEHKFPGWSRWLYTQRPQKDVDDLVLTPLVAQDKVVSELRSGS